MDTNAHSATHGVMHQDHLEAHQAHMHWLDAIRRWKLEHRTVLAQLEAMMKAYDAELDRQADCIKAHERHIERHEKAILQHALGGDGKQHDWLATQHESLRKRHTEVYEQHLAMDTRHEEMLSMLKGVLAGFETPV